jgi:hypothetical protein
MGLRSRSSPRLASWPTGEVKWVPIAQDFPDRAVSSPPQALLDGLSPVAGRVRDGDRVAVAIGSRGISSIVEVSRSLIGWLKSQGADPFIVPAMGSHGGGSAEGQVEVLEALGICESTVGAPIVSGMETVQVGTTPNGVPVFADRHAFAADLVIPVARVKPHTDFRGTIESGPTKMLVIGLGNRNGAEAIHSVGLARLSETIAEAGQVVIRGLKVPFCVAIVEDAHESAAVVEVVPSEALAAREPELLLLAREWMPYLPVPDLDVLVVQEMGKNISGDGMDPNITGRFYDPVFTSGPSVQRLAVLDLTAETGGNATGVGMADIVTSRLAGKVDWHQTYTNEVTSNTPQGARLPLVAVDDEEALAVAVKTLGSPPSDKVRLGWIKNTLSLSRLMVTLPVLESLNGKARILGDPAPIGFHKGALDLPAL